MQAATAKSGSGEPGWKKGDRSDLWAGFGDKKAKRLPDNLRPYGFEVGVAALKRGDFEGAVGPLEAAARAKADDTLILAALAGAHLGLRELEQAESEYKQALAHASPDAAPPIRLGLAESYRLRGQDEEANEAYRQVLDDPRATQEVKRVAAVRIEAAKLR
jgi:tetratricopeptide (TPR) repeat protein